MKNLLLAIALFFSSLFGTHHVTKPNVTTVYHVSPTPSNTPSPTIIATASATLQTKKVLGTQQSTPLSTGTPSPTTISPLPSANTQTTGPIPQTPTQSIYVPQSTSQQLPTIVFPTYPLTPTPTPLPTSTPQPDNVQISFRLYWDRFNAPRADYYTSVCLGSLDVVWGHFYIIDPSGQEQNTGNQDYRQKPCQKMGVVGYSLSGKPIGEYTFKAVFDELGVTKTSKATLGSPSL